MSALIIYLPGGGAIELPLGTKFRTVTTDGKFQRLEAYDPMHGAWITYWRAA